MHNEGGRQAADEINKSRVQQKDRVDSEGGWSDEQHHEDQEHIASNPERVGKQMDCHRYRIQRSVNSDQTARVVAHALEFHPEHICERASRRDS